MNINGANDPFYRYKMNVIESYQLQKKKKTYWTNFDEIMHQLYIGDLRQKHFLQKFSKHFGTSVKHLKGQLEMRGLFNKTDMQIFLRDYIDNFVLCINCGNPETGTGVCSACGTTVDFSIN